MHAYIQLAMMRMGRVRAILQMVSERVAFGRLDKTISAWVERVLAEPDTTLETYAALGSERLGAFSEAFAADPSARSTRYSAFPSWSATWNSRDVVDMRPVDLESEEIDESSDGVEIAPDFQEARGVSDGSIEEWQEKHQQLPEAEEEPAAEVPDEAAEKAALDDAVFEYVFEYTREHLSPVVARALRAYRVRGVAVAATEFTITKAPRKTLGAILKFARCRFRHVVAIFDNFDAWPLADNDLRSKVVGSISEVRSLLGDDLEMVFLVEKDLAPELEEQFGHGRRVTWDFGNLDSYFEDPESLQPAWIDSWLASAALSGADAAVRSTTLCWPRCWAARRAVCSDSRRWRRPPSTTRPRVVSARSTSRPNRQVSQRLWSLDRGTRHWCRGGAKYAISRSLYLRRNVPRELVELDSGGRHHREMRTLWPRVGD